MWAKLKKLFQKEGKHFLIVDDNIQINEYLREYLQKFGHRCSCLSNESEVMVWMKSQSCDAIILDLNLGIEGRDGIHLLQEIRKVNPSLPVVIFTGEGYDELRLQSAMQSGANGYVSKSIRPSDMYAALMKALQMPLS